MHHRDENLKGKYSFYYWGPYLFQTAISPKVAKTLLSEGKKLTKKFNESLAGQIKKEFIYTDASFFMPEFTRIVDLYLEGYRHFANLPNYKANFNFKNMWINYQKKNEFIPNHIHDGAFSYTIWIDIPYDSDEELKEGGEHASCFQFSYTDILGATRLHHIKLNKKDNGRMLFFPAQLRHQVYPFYTSDKYRISISGNVLLDVKFNN